MMNHKDLPLKVAPGPLDGARCPFHSSSQRMVRDGAGYKLRTTEGSDWCILHRAKCDKELRERYGCGSSRTPGVREPGS